MMNNARRWAVYIAILVVGPLSTGARAVTPAEVSASCGPCHALIVNGIVVSTDSGKVGETQRVNGRSKVRWVASIQSMVRQGAIVDDVDGTAAYLAGLGLPTPTPTPPLCTGDCDGSGGVTATELVTFVNIALGNLPLSGCPAGHGGSSEAITVNEIVAATNHALNDCSLP